MSRNVLRICVAVVCLVVLGAAWAGDAVACDKPVKAVSVATVVRPHSQPIPICPPVPCCCEDARICIVEEAPPVCYTEAGLNAFVAIFRGAAAQGVENATIRAFNATKVVPDCVKCDDKKKK